MYYYLYNIVTKYFKSKQYTDVTCLFFAEQLKRARKIIVCFLRLRFFRLRFMCGRERACVNNYRIIKVKFEAALS